MQNQKTTCLIWVALWITAFLANCNETEIQSIWHNGQIRIDAKSKDWQSNLTWNEKNKLGLGIANDSTDLYVCLTTSDRGLHRQIMMRGFILNVDQKGSKNHNFGIKFPTGISNQGFQPVEGSFERPNDFRGRQNPENDIMGWMDDIQTELILLGPGKEDEEIIPIENNLGLNVKIGREREQLVYEIKIPFSLISEQLKIDKVVMTNALAVNFKTGEFKLPGGRPEGMHGDRSPDELGERPDRPPSGGGMGGPGGGGMGGPGGGGMGGVPGGQMSSQQSFNYIIKVILATGK